MARLILVAKAKASLKGHKSHRQDPKPSDIILSKVKFSERKIEA